MARKNRGRALRPYGYIAPLLVWWGMIIAYPLVRAIYLELYGLVAPGPHDQFSWAYRTSTSIFAGGATTTAFEFTVVFALCSTAVEILAGGILALLFSRLRPGFGWLIGVVMIPWAISEIVTATAGAWLFNGQFGMVNGVLHALFGIKPVWLSNVTLARPASRSS